MHLIPTGITPIKLQMFCGFLLRLAKVIRQISETQMSIVANPYGMLHCRRFSRKSVHTTAERTKSCWGYRIRNDSERNNQKLNKVLSFHFQIILHHRPDEYELDMGNPLHNNSGQEGLWKFRGLWKVNSYQLLNDQ